MTKIIIDTHCHLDQPQFDGDREGVIERARAAGVGLIIVPGIDLESSRQAVELAGRHEGVYAAVGVHPDECGSFDEASLETLRELAQSPKVVAIGEIGLDYYWESQPHDRQKVALQGQLRVAGELGLPVILHSRGVPQELGRDSNAELLCELAQWVPEIRTRRGPDAILGVLHAFSGELRDAQTAYDLGFVLSLGGPVTFKNARRLNALVPQLRRDRLMLETDAPYLAPHPLRGKRNEPAYLPLVVAALAERWQTTPQAIIDQTTRTALQCFKNLAKA